MDVGNGSKLDRFQREMAENPELGKWVKKHGGDPVREVGAIS